MGRLSKAAEEARKVIYGEVKSDQEGAERSGVSVDAWKSWLRANKMPYKTPVDESKVTSKKAPKPGSKLDPKVDEERTEAYWATNSDGEAAKKLGMERASFAYWRHSRGLPARGSPQPSKTTGPKKKVKGKAPKLQAKGPTKVSSSMADKVVLLIRETERRDEDLRKRQEKLRDLAQDFERRSKELVTQFAEKVRAL